jgi:predicted nucleotidyltransferase
MQADPVLKQIIKALVQKGCHTVILYGSRARGDFTQASDYDVLGVSSKRKAVTRIAKKMGHHYWDVFIFPERDLKNVGESHLYMKDGVVLLDKNKFGSHFLARLKKLDRVAPKKLAAWDVQLRKTWTEKTFKRSQSNDPDGNFRRLSLITTMLEDYFALRQKRYNGSKESLAWLKAHDSPSYRLFLTVLRSPRNDAALRKLVKRVIS